MDSTEHSTPSERQHPDLVERLPTDHDKSAGDFFVVGVGASAGGLEALERFFTDMPAETGMAFVVVQHLSPDFESLMDQLLAQRTEIPIHVSRTACLSNPMPCI